MALRARAVRSRDQVLDWVRRRPLDVDVVLAVAFGVATLVDIGASGGGAREVDALAYLLGVVGAVSLVWRRFAPVLVAAIAAAVLAAFWIAGYASLLATVGLPALYSLAVHGQPRRRAWTLYVGLSVAVMTVASVTVLDPPSGFATLPAVSMALYLAGTGALAALVRRRQQTLEDVEVRAVRAEADRLAAAQQAVAEERARIAREMHDIVAHGMSVVVVQAAAAQEIARIDPERVVDVLARIEEVSRESLDEMRRMLGLLRPSARDGRGAWVPQPGLADVEAAVARSNQSGVPTQLVVRGEPRRLPPGVELAAFRIVQEALTNVRQHAGPSPAARVSIDYAADSVTVSVVDDGRGAASPATHTGGGNGLIGMRERVDAYHGRFTAGPMAGGGYQVTAVLPATEGQVRPAVPADTLPRSVAST